MLWKSCSGIVVLLAVLALVGCDETSSQTQKPVATKTPELDKGTEGPAKQSNGTPSIDASDPAVAVDRAEDGPRVLTPASFTEVIQVIDLRDIQFPFFVSTRREARRSIGSFRLPLDQAKELVLPKILELGCTLETDELADGMHTMEFTKGDYSLSAFMYEQKLGDGKSHYVIVNNGNVDSRLLPAPDNSEPKVRRYGHSSYTTEMEAELLFGESRRRLLDEGWLECTHGDDQQQSLASRFVKNGIQVTMSVSSTEQARELAYTISIVDGELPVPPDAKDIHLDMVEDTLSCRSPSSLSEVTDFYQRRFRELGWKRNERIGRIDEDRVSIDYFWGRDATSIELEKADGHTTVHLVGLISDTPDSK